jgi:hypothetical protein
MGPKATPAEWAEMFLREVEAMPVLEKSTTTRRENFAANIRKILADIPTSKAAFCRNAGITSMTLDRWAADGIDTDYGPARKLAAYLGIVADSLWEPEIRLVPATEEKPVTQVQQDETEAEYLRKVQVALRGPRSRFLRESIDISYGITVASGIES